MKFYKKSVAKFLSVMIALGNPAFVVGAINDKNGNPKTAHETTRSSGPYARPAAAAAADPDTPPAAAAAAVEAPRLTVKDEELVKVMDSFDESRADKLLANGAKITHEAISRCIVRGNHRAFNYALEHLPEEFDLNCLLPKGTTLLHLAVYSGTEAMVDGLLAKGANQNIRNRAGQTPLMWAALRAGECRDIRTQKQIMIYDYDDTPYYPKASEYPAIKIMHILLEHAADPNVLDGDGNTALMIFMNLLWQNKDRHHYIADLLDMSTQCCREMVNHGVDVNIQNKVGHTAVSLFLERFCCLCEDEMPIQPIFEVMNLFASHGRQLSEENIEMCLGIAMDTKLEPAVTAATGEYGGFPPLIRAIDMGDTAKLEKMLNLPCNTVNLYGLHKCKVEQLDNRSALTFAAESGLLGAVQRLYERGGVSLDARDHRGETALTIAAKNNNHTVVRFLLQSEANPEERNADGKTALMEAAICGSKEAVQELLGYADLMAVDNVGNTALMLAIWNEKFDIASLLIAYMTRNARDSLNIQKKSVLRYAVLVNNLEFMRYLLSHVTFERRDIGEARDLAEGEGCGEAKWAIEWFLNQNG